MLDMMDILYEALGGLKNIPHELSLTRVEPQQA